MSIEQQSWPVARLGEGLQELARLARLSPAQADTLLMPAAVVSAGIDEIDRWINWAADSIGIEAEPVKAPASEALAMLMHAAPAVCLFWLDGDLRFVLIRGRRLGRLVLIGPDLQQHHERPQWLADTLCGKLHASLVAEIDAVLAAAQIPARHHERTRRAMIAERLRGETVTGCWILRPRAQAGLTHQFRHAGLARRVGGMLAVFAVIYGLEIAGWSVMGEAALDGRLDLGWLGAWVLLLLTVIPLRLLGNWLDASFALEAGRIVKRRLIAGALAMDPDRIRHQGAGQLLGRVMESQALESLALNTGLGLLLAAVELVFAGWILAKGAGAAFHLPLLGGWLVLTGWLGWRYWKRLDGWTGQRLDMTHALIERMVGHRTRLAQESPGRRDEQDDVSVREYFDASHALDRAAAPLLAGLPGGWLMLGLLGLAPAFVTSQASPAGLAIGLGGVMLANRAFGGVAAGMASLAGALIAWKQVSALFKAGDVTAVTAPFLEQGQLDGRVPAHRRAHLVQASGLNYQHPGAAQPVLRNVDLRIQHGERILLEGPSGGGKSTLAALLTGLRLPDSGLLLLNGLDRHTLGDGWHQMATEAPQFHENHVFSGTLGFNLLMGRNWPASDQELDEARQICEELGLGDLLARMPSGMMQMVGETGWQLSHGERSRVFLARALLQHAPLTIMDESFAALDPRTLRQCLQCSIDRAQTLMVIAHP